ncbi:hypothetical protein B0920_06315 [Massilia sp. KIM]|uniref:LysR family transcriptional regulator n=1 Tax=Massilia sp. KIM TaxID=1955422 RepID=UPI00098F7FEE|nr:LysR family transcriptional regulator [Massilia sp. KIM]OON63030.1 hypothetical protein B0920_06315 [Massilia sp. KIM]
MQEDLDWGDIPYILALFEAGSVNAAAERLGVAATTVSRRLNAAERRVGTRLFVRDHMGIRPTAAGSAFLAHAELAARHVTAMLRSTKRLSGSVSGPVRVSAIDFLFDHWLLERVPDLIARHPALDLVLAGENRNTSFTRGEADFALRLGRPENDAAAAMRKLADIGWSVFGGEGLGGAVPDDWASLPWLSYHEGLRHLPEMEWIAQRVPAARSPLRLDSLSTMIQACRAGAGLALLPCLVEGTPGLVRLSPQVEVRRELWLLSHRDAVTSVRNRAVTDWLVEACVRSRDRLEGSDVTLPARLA